MLWPCFGHAAQPCPPERAAAFGARLGRALGPHLHWHRRLRDNLAIALPHASADQVETCARAVWGSFGATLAEYAHFGTIGDRAFEQHVEVVLHPGIEARRNGGWPFVFVTAHLANWEISAATARHPGLPLTVVYSPQANPLTHWLVQRAAPASPLPVSDDRRWHAAAPAGTSRSACWSMCASRAAMPCRSVVRRRPPRWCRRGSR